MKTATKPNVVREILLKLERPETGPYQAICMYGKQGGEEIFTVVGHSTDSVFDVVVYKGPSKNEAITRFYEMVLNEDKNKSNNLDDEL